MNNKIVLTFALLGSFLLASCVQVPQENSPTSKQNNLAVSSVRDIPLSFAPGSLFSLSPKHLKHTSLKTEQTQAVYAQYAHAIIQDLEDNGFENAKNNSAPVFHVGFSVALASDLSDDTINGKFGVSPGLPESEGLQKGSFLIYIEDAFTGKTVWRGAAQGFVHEEFSEAEQEARSSNVVSIVMAQFYATN
ncbi:hypothetical protein GCM10009111_03210 [Colwellia asteriadis]|uniref:DUF4136 domain-containing protein n=1 Tax=Colwellia asteriadis TaxID=517723 RepID=A0ABP3WFG4_9GAMM